MNLSTWLRVFRARYGLACGFWIFAEGIVLASVMPLLPILLANHIGLDKSQLTLYFLISTLLGTVITLSTGYLSDGWVARYKLVLIGGLASAAGYIGLATATQPTDAFVSGALIAGIGILFPQLFAVAKSGVMADWSPSDQITGTTALRTLFSLGFVGGTAVGSWMARTVELQSIFFTMAVAIAGLTLGTAWFLFKIERAISQHEIQREADEYGYGDSEYTETGTPHKPKRKAVSLPVSALIMPLLALIVLRGADSTRTAYISLVMLELFSDASIGPTMFGLTAAAELITMALISELASRIGERNAIIVGSMFGVIYFLVMTFSQNLTLLYLMQIVYAMFIAALMGVAMAYVQRMIASRAGFGGSLYITVFNIGSLAGILSPLLVTGYSPLIFVAPAIMCVIGALILVFGDRTKEIEHRLRDINANEAQVQTVLLQPMPPLAVEGEH
jgi:SET family sugar efflux transporter-like MFS transporter